MFLPTAKRLLAASLNWAGVVFSRLAQALRLETKTLRSCNRNEMELKEPVDSVPATVVIRLHELEVKLALFPVNNLIQVQSGSFVENLRATRQKSVLSGEVQG
jgi:hypothetical protein